MTRGTNVATGGEGHMGKLHQTHVLPPNFCRTYTWRKHGHRRSSVSFSAWLYTVSAWSDAILWDILNKRFIAQSVGLTGSTCSLRVSQ